MEGPSTGEGHRLPPPGEKETFSALRYAGVGVTFMAEMAAFAALGWWADRELGTEPWLLFAGFVVGTILATYSLIKMVEGAEDRSKKWPGPREKDR